MNENMKKIFGYAGGTFPEEEMNQAKINGNPLTLDLAIPGACLNDCIFCGYKDTQKGKKLSFEEIIDIIEQFSKLGGKSIKILGEGEPLLREDILTIYEQIHSYGLQSVLFTCGNVLGDDKLAKKIFGGSGEEIIKKLSECKTTIMLKFEAKKQDNIVQRKGYSAKRNLALERLINEGFNQYQPTHLGFGIVVLKYNLQEIPINYKFAIRNNIYPLLCPLMPIGKAANLEYRSQIGISQSEIVKLSANIYTILSEEGIEVKYPADFPGGLPCDIARAGFYIGDTGDIYVCESEEKIGNIGDLSLSEAWTRIKGIKDAKYKNNRWSGFCYEKRRQKILPENFDELVLAELKR